MHKGPRLLDDKIKDHLRCLRRGDGTTEGYEAIWSSAVGATSPYREPGASTHPQVLTSFSMLHYLS